MAMAAWRRMSARISGRDTGTWFRFAAASVPMHQPGLAQLWGAGGLSPCCAEPDLATRRRTALFGRNGVLPSSGEHAPLDVAELALEKTEGMFDPRPNACLHALEPLGQLLPQFFAYGASCHEGSEPSCSAGAPVPPTSRGPASS